MQLEEDCASDSNCLLCLFILFLILSIKSGMQDSKTTTVAIFTTSMIQLLGICFYSAVISQKAAHRRNQAFVRVGIMIGTVLLLMGVQYGGSQMFMGLSLLVAAYCFGVLRGGRPGPTLVATVALLTSAAGLLGVQFFNWCLLSAVLTYVSVIFEIEEFIHDEQPLHQLQEQEQEEQERRPRKGREEVRQALG